MKRFSLEARGFINFPINNPRFEKGDGGCFVRLVVLDKRHDSDEWMLCIGGHALALHDGAYVRDDVRPNRSDDNQQEHDQYAEVHFPDINREDSPTKYESMHYLAVLTLGSCGTAFFDTHKEDNWFCTYDDLTPEGRRLYDDLKALYKGCDIYIQTWVDT